MVLKLLKGPQHTARTQADYAPQQFFPTSLLSFIASGLLKNLLQKGNARTEDFYLALNGCSFLEMDFLEEIFDRGERTDLVLIIDSGYSCQGSFEGGKRFGYALSDIECNRSTPNGPVFPVSFRDNWRR